ncbi:hypothetical protein [Streptomyces mangrovi]|uniref:hypothetical protein n=1 Tax=Streptomyces mangrovi TaxID=1206892 RepID=UPI00399CC2FB
MRLAPAQCLEQDLRPDALRACGKPLLDELLQRSLVPWVLGVEGVELLGDGRALVWESEAEQPILRDGGHEQ